MTKLHRLHRSAFWRHAFAMLGLLFVAGQEPAWWIAPGYAAPGLYRWVDEDGAVHYSDQIPPARVEQGHTKLNREGVRTETVPRAPTAEEIRQVQAQEQQRRDEQQRTEQEHVANQQLLNRFRSMDDLILAREGQIAAVEALGQTTRDGIRVEQRQLRELHRKTNELTQAGKPVAATFQNEIATAERRIRDGYLTILEQEFRKETIRKDFNALIMRYRTLKKLPEVPDQMRETGALSRNVVRCEGSEPCLRAWEGALAYVRAQAGKTEEILGPGLMMAAQQDEREDRLLTLIWLQKTPEEPVYLYLDLECKNRLTANLTCTNPAALAIRDGFRAAL